MSEPTNNELIKRVKELEKELNELNQEIQQLRKREKSLQESEEILRAQFMNSPDIIFILDRRNRFVMINRVITGPYTAEGLVGMDAVEVLPPNARKPIRNKIVECFETGLVQETEHEIGENKWVHARIVPLKKMGIVENVLVISTNITERKRAEDTMRKSEKILSEAQRIAHLGSFEYDFRTNVLLWSDEVFHIFGVFPENFCGKIEDFVNRIHPEDQERVSRIRKESLLHGGTANFEHRIIRPDGSERIVHERYETSFDESGQPLYRIGIVQDITEQKLMEEVLRRSQQQLVIRNQISNIFLTKPDNEMYNAVLQVILKTLESESGVFGYIDDNGALVCPSMTKTLWDQCQTEEKDIVFPRETWGNSIWGRILREKEGFFSNSPFNVPQGHLPINRALGVPLINQNELIGLFIVANKVSEYTEDDKELLEIISIDVAPLLYARLENERQKKRQGDLEEQLFQSQKMESIGRLAGGIAHDFNNILTGIMGYAELLQMQFEDTSTPERQAVDVILKGTERAADLTQQLLGFARGGKYNPAPLKINDVIKECIKVSEKIFEKNIEVKYQFNENINIIEADKNQMHQVLTNIIINARDAMPVGGELIFSTENIFIDKVSV